MKTTFLPVLMASLLAMAPAIGFAEQAVQPQPSKYLSGPVSRDAAAALKRGAAEQKPVWLIVWDQVFFRSAEGKKVNIADYSLSNFYGNPETKKLISANFIQAFTTMDNPAVAQWIDAADISHEPILIVIAKDGTMVARKHSSANSANGLQDVQEIVSKLK
jgi:hypothetical protein